MKEVPPRVVEKVWGKMEKMSRSASAKMMEQMGKEQPMLLGYLGSVDEESLNEGERGILVYLGLFIWQAMKQVGGYLPRVSEDAMIRAEVATVTQFKNLATQEETGSGGVDAILQACGQSELMDFALAALMEAAGYDEENEAAEGEASADAAKGEECDRCDECDECDECPERDECPECEDYEEDEDALVRAENVPLLMMNLKTVVDVLNV